MVVVGVHHSFINGSTICSAEQGERGGTEAAATEVPSGIMQRRSEWSEGLLLQAQGVRDALQVP